MSDYADDARLVERTRAGDPDAFGQLIDRYHSMVRALAASKLGRPQDVEDLVQDAFVRAYRSLDSLNDPTCFAAWLYRLTHRMAVDTLRARGRRAAVSLDALREQAVELCGDDGRDLRRQGEDREVVWHALQKLSHNYQVVLTLRYFKGMSYRAIARHLGEPEGTIANRIHRAIGQLRQVLAPTRSSGQRAHKGGGA